MADSSALFERIRAGDRRALARAATVLENGTNEATELLRLIQPFAGHARTIGITGPPGAGKSTLVNAMTRSLRTVGKAVGIVAVDPSSPVSQGALLGDRIRMQEHHGDPGVFVRSLAARGHGGGLAKAALSVGTLFEAARFDVVLIETVGVGQDEVAICGQADVTIAVLVPGLGDDVQAIKAGLMETADVFAINKADLPGAEQTEQFVQQMQSLGEEKDNSAPVRRVVASDGTGVQELLNVALTMPSRRRPDFAKRSPATIDHLGIAVASIGEAAKFYTDQLGLEITGRETVRNELVDVAMLSVGDSRIELLEATGPESPIARFLAKRTPGLHHIALKVPDLSATVARISAAGGRLLNEPRTGAGGHLYVFVHPATTGGVLLELIQA